MGTITEDYFSFGNIGGPQQGVVAPTTVASTTNMPAPTRRVTTVSGTAAVSTIDLPWPGFTGSISYIPTAAMTGALGAAAGSPNALSFPVGVAFTCVAKKVQILTFDGAAWYPSYTN